jgi:hypothetical protein
MYICVCDIQAYTCYIIFLFFLRFSLSLSTRANDPCSTVCVLYLPYVHLCMYIEFRNTNFTQSRHPRLLSQACRWECWCHLMLPGTYKGQISACIYSESKCEKCACMGTGITCTKKSYLQIYTEGVLRMMSDMVLTFRDRLQIVLFFGLVCTDTKPRTQTDACIPVSTRNK